jgi:hypothetical protein
MHSSQLQRHDNEAGDGDDRPHRSTEIFADATIEQDGVLLTPIASNTSSSSLAVMVSSRNSHRPSGTLDAVISGLTFGIGITLRY